MKSIGRSMIGVALMGCVGVSGAVAAERDHGWSRWKAGEIEQSREAAKYGPACKAGFTSRGTGPVGFGITQFWAKRHTTRNWEDAAVKLAGSEYGKWRKARDKTVTCERNDKQWDCKATGIPCT
jgi:hypothetical protein